MIFLWSFVVFKKRERKLRTKICHRGGGRINMDGIIFCVNSGGLGFN